MLETLHSPNLYAKVLADFNKPVINYNDLEVVRLVGYGEDYINAYCIFAHSVAFGQEFPKYSRLSCVCWYIKLDYLKRENINKVWNDYSRLDNALQISGLKNIHI